MSVTKSFPLSYACWPKEPICCVVSVATRLTRVPIRARRRRPVERDFLALVALDLRAPPADFRALLVPLRALAVPLRAVFRDVPRELFLLAPRAVGPRDDELFLLALFRPLLRPVLLPPDLRAPALALPRDDLLDFFALEPERELPRRDDFLVVAISLLL